MFAAIILLVISIHDPFLNVLFAINLCFQTAIFARIPIKNLTRFLKSWLIFLIPVAVINFWYYPFGYPVMEGLGYWLIPGIFMLTVEGVVYALANVLRFLALLLGLRTILLITPIYDLILALVKLKLPPSAGLALNLTLSYLPVLTRMIENIKNAQELRGWKMRSKNPLTAIRRFAPILIPAIKGATRESYKLAAALESRGYGYDIAHRTYRKELKFSKNDYIVTFILLTIIVIGVIIGRYTSWMSTFHILLKLLGYKI